MTILPQSPRSSVEQILINSFGKAPFSNFTMQKIDRLASELLFNQINTYPTWGLDTKDRPYFSIKVQYKPDGFWPILFAVVMYYHENKWNGFITRKPEEFEGFFGEENEWQRPRNAEEFIQDLFAGKLSDYQLILS